MTARVVVTGHAARQAERRFALSAEQVRAEVLALLAAGRADPWNRAGRSTATNDHARFVLARDADDVTVVVTVHGRSDFDPRQGETAVAQAFRRAQERAA